jgi:hypothetical protein
MLILQLQICSKLGLYSLQYNPPLRDMFFYIGRLSQVLYSDKRPKKLSD